MARAARTSDSHVCLQKEPHAHVGGPISSGCQTVVIGDELAARVGDRAFCHGGPDDVITSGSQTVVIAGQPAARKGDKTDGGSITGGFASVRIGGGKTPLRRRRTV